MADLEHTTLTTIQVHEPKHLTGALTTDTGKVITSSSSVNGQSEYRKLSVEDLDTTGSNIIPKYGAMVVINNTTPVAVTAAANPSLVDAADYIQVLPDTVVYSSVNLKGITFANNELTVDETGIYNLMAWSDVGVTSGNNTLVGFKISINGELSSAVPSGKDVVPSSSVVANVSAQVLISLSAGDSIGVAVAANRTTGVIFGDSVINLIKVDSTT